MSKVTSQDVELIKDHQTVTSWLPRGSLLFPRRLHLFEINDQPWWPQILREKVQDCLTRTWITKLPLIQSSSPAALVAHVLSSVLGPRVSDYVYVDFASGAGGPTPFIEKQLNTQLQQDGKRDVSFVLTDIKPHLDAWSAAAKKSDNLHYVRQSVDATNAPPAEELLKDVPGVEGKKIMRLFSLAFHHFDDDLAAKVLENTIETADGFCIFELQSRQLSSFITISLWPFMLLINTIHFLNSPAHLIFTYLIPLVPFVLIFDGYVSALRTRTPEEVQALLRSRVSDEQLVGWKFKSGEACHTWPIGWANWVICYKES